MRDVQLSEAKKLKEYQAQEQRMKELELVGKLRKEIDDEKDAKINKKKNEREVALKVIQENEVQKAKMLMDRDREREQENRTIEEYNKMIEIQE
jgi:hypothetical protein